jgi:hypothetical protein
MKKSDELNNPGSCLSKAKDEELIFVLLERDPCIVATIAAWINARIESGVNSADDPKIKEAMEFCNQVAERKLGPHLVSAPLAFNADVTNATD